MNTEKLEKLEKFKKQLDNKLIPDGVKDKIRNEIENLESEIKSEDITATELKKEVAKVEEKVEVAVEKAEKKAESTEPKKGRGRPRKTPATTPVEPKATETAIKKTAMVVAKTIRKDGEKWNDAMKRANSVMKKEKVEVKKTTKSELDRLLARVRKNKSLMSELKGVKDLGRDAVRTAKPVGKRISESGNVYYEYRANKPDRKTYGKYAFELGGSVVTDLAGHTGGGTGGFNPRIPLDGFSNTAYTGLVGETGAMSSGEMFMSGGGVGMANQQVIDDASQSYVNYYLGEGTAQGIYKDGGAIMNQYEGKTPEQIWNMLSISQRYHFLHDHKKEIESTPASVEKATKTAYKFLPEKIKISFKNHIVMGQYAKGGSVTNERRYVNKGEDYEVRYSRPRPARKGYLGKRDFSRGGLTGESARVEFLKEEFASQDLIDELKEKLRLKSNDLKNQDVIAFAYTNYGGTIIDKYAIEYFLENYPRNIVVEETSYNGKNAYVFGKPAKEWMEQSDDYVLGFDDFESFYYEKENEDFMEGINFFIQDLKRNYTFNEDEVRDSLEEKFYGYFNVDTSGLDYSEEQMIDYLNEEGLIKEEEFAKGGGVRKVGNREYSYGRNWTNDQRHVNQSEEHEVKYTRKGKFLGIFAKGGGVDKWIGYDKDHLMNMKNGMIVLRGTDLKDIKPKDIKGFDMLDNRGYSKGGSVTNERRHVNKDEDYEVRYSRPRPARKGYLGKRDFAGGGSVNDDTPKIYVADLEAYNNGKLSGVWLDLTDYSDADELMDAINDFLKTTGGEEYAIHDYENLPRSMYSEYMGARDFAELYEMIDLAKENDLPLDVVMEMVSQFDAMAVREHVGTFDSEQDFAEQLVDDLGGIQNFNDFQYYLEVSDTDRRLLSQDMADGYVDDIRDEDGGNRLIEEAGLDVDEYEEADSERQDEMLDEAREIVYDEYYNNYFEGLSDPYYFLVEEQGMYDAESFANANFVRVDYEKLGDALEQDYTFVRHDGKIYVFNIR